MPAIRHIPLSIAVSLVMSLMSLTALGLVMHAHAMQPSSASSGPLHDPSTSPPDQHRHGPLVTLRVQALVPEKITLSDPAQGTVRATVLAIDGALNQITVQTDEGQRLMLFLDPASLARLRVGTPCLLQVVNRSPQETPRPSEHEEAFW